MHAYVFMRACIVFVRVFVAGGASWGGGRESGRQAVGREARASEGCGWTGADRGRRRELKVREEGGRVRGGGWAEDRLRKRRRRMEAESGGAGPRSGGGTGRARVGGLVGGLVTRSGHLPQATAAGGGAGADWAARWRRQRESGAGVDGARGGGGAVGLGDVRLRRAPDRGGGRGPCGALSRFRVIVRGLKPGPPGHDASDASPKPGEAVTGLCAGL